MAIALRTEPVWSFYERQKQLVTGLVRYILLYMGPERYADFMELAIREAELALHKAEVPVGAIVVHDGKIIGRGHNLTASMHDATAHAEIVALSAAYSHFNDWRLENCYLFSTLEPCAMCAGAAVLSRIKMIVYGARDPKFGGCGSIFNIPSERRLNHRIRVVSGVREEEIARMMRLFFNQVRQQKGQIN